MIVSLALVPAGRAQEPLSAIDWLSRNAQQGQASPEGIAARDEPPAASRIERPKVSVASLGGEALRIGLVPTTITGLPETVWEGSSPDSVAARIAAAAPSLPALRALLLALLLSEARHPGPDDPVLIARIDLLLEFGAVEPALALAGQAGAASDPALFARAFDAALLLGTEDTQCAAMARLALLAPDPAARVFCLARDGDLAAATVIFDAASALDLLAPPMRAALDRFLHPESFDDAPALPAPDHPGPLLFRLHEAFGEGLPTANLPAAFANADLRRLSGWKAELQAAERLTRIGAVTPNRLLGAYSERLPAASGGVWDRVEAVQRFETALRTRSPDAVSKSLRRVWNAMQTASLEVALATLFEPDLRKIPMLDPQGTALAYRVALLSPDYETATLPDIAGDDLRFLAALARGTPQQVAPYDARAAAVAAAFGDNPSLPEGSADRPLGAAILDLIAMVSRGSNGALPDLSAGLEGLRALGLEDSARRAALQWLILAP